MTNPQAYLNDFVAVNTQFSYDDNKSDNRTFESSDYASVQDMFESHLANSLIDVRYLGEYNIDVYKLKVGDNIILRPSEWALAMDRKHDLDSSKNESYNFTYMVQDIQITMYSRQPVAVEDIPKLQIDIILKRV